MWRWMLTYRGRHFATDAASKTHVAQLKLTQWCRSTISWLQRWNTLPPQERTGVWIDLGRTPRQILQAKKRKEIAGPYVWLIPPMRGGETCLLGSCLHVNAREKVMPLTVTAVEDRDSWKWRGWPFTSPPCFCFVWTLLKSIFMFYLGWKRKQEERKTRKGKKTGPDCRKQNCRPPQEGSWGPGSLCLPLACRCSHPTTSIPAKGLPRGPCPRSQGHQRGFKQQQVSKKQKQPKNHPPLIFCSGGI